MAIKFQEQAVKVGQLLTSSKTYQAYRDAILVTGELLKEIALLGWYAILMLLVLIDWLIATGRRVVFGVRVWVADFDNDSQDAGAIASEAGKTIASASRDSLVGLFSQARTQLGLPERTEPELVMPIKEAKPEPEPVEVSPAPVVEPTASVAPTPTTPEPITFEPTPVEPANDVVTDDVSTTGNDTIYGA